MALHLGRQAEVVPILARKGFHVLVAPSGLARRLPMPMPMPIERRSPRPRSSPRATTSRRTSQTRGKRGRRLAGEAREVTGGLTEQAVTDVGVEPHNKAHQARVESESRQHVRVRGRGEVAEGDVTPDEGADGRRQLVEVPGVVAREPEV